MLCAGLGTFVTYNPTTVSPDAELAQAMRLMEQHGFRHLPVTGEDKQLKGVISDLDVTRALLAQRAWSAHLPAGQAGQICRIDDIMMHAPSTVDVEDSPHRVLLMILEKGFHSLPVVQDGKLVGITTSSDFLREMSYGEIPGSRLAVAEHMSEANMSVPATASIDEAGDEMQQHGIEQLVVVNGDFPLGIVSLHAVRRATATGESAATAAAGSIRKLLTRDAATIALEASLGEAANRLIEQRVKALAVIDIKNHLRGLLTEDDLLRAIAGEWID